MRLVLIHFHPMEDTCIFRRKLLAGAATDYDSTYMRDWETRDSFSRWPADIANDVYSSTCILTERSRFRSRELGVTILGPFGTVVSSKLNLTCHYELAWTWCSIRTYKTFYLHREELLPVQHHVLGSEEYD